MIADRGRAEVVSTGIDESVQGYGGDPFGSNAQMGLRIPAFVPNNGSPPLNRYLFLLSTFSLSTGQKARLRGYRQLATIGLNTAGEEEQPRYVEQLITSPFWHFPDGDISWHLQDIGPAQRTSAKSQSGPVPPDSKFTADNFAFRSTDTPSLLYETAMLVGPYYTDLTSYVPPNGGRPWGTPLFKAGFSTMYDLRTLWETSQAWTALDVPLTGPRTIALYASVKQSTPHFIEEDISGGRPLLTVPDPFYPGGLSIEEQFLLNFPEAVYWRVAGSLIVDTGE
jgi:hypothetical protein